MNRCEGDNKKQPGLSEPTAPNVSRQGEKHRATQLDTDKIRQRCMPLRTSIFTLVYPTSLVVERNVGIAVLGLDESHLISTNSGTSRAAASRPKARRKTSSAGGESRTGPFRHLP